MAELILSPEWGFTQTNQPSHRRFKMGDHYTFDSAVADGYREEWSLSAKGLSETAIEYYINFLESCAGVIPMQWRPNSSMAFKDYWCDSMSASEVAPDLWNVSLTLKEAR